MVPISFYQLNTTLIFLLAHLARNGAAGFLETGKIPEIGKFTALLRLDRLDGAIVALQKKATAVRFFQQGQSAAIPAQPGELLDEIVFADAFERREPGDFRV